MPLEIECPRCNGVGCDECAEGVFKLSSCPREYIGQELTLAVNVASMAIKGQMPIAGGTLDQSAWFVDLMQMLESEQNRIDNERTERLYG